MSVEPEIAEREPAATATSIAHGSPISLERGITDPLFCGSLKSSKGAAAIPSALNHDERVQTTSEIGTTGVVKLPSTAGAFPTHNGNGSTRGDGAGVIKRGIDLLPHPELNKAIAFTETCPTCGGPLTQGECLRCLVSLGFLSDSQQPDKVENGRRLTPGPLKYDHFEVEVGAEGFPVELGAGAMAITYRARDTVLNSTVALKVIDRRVAQNPGARSRFLREARLAAQIRHPNVARVSHYGEQDGECFYVMELVEGETLEAKVRREGPMPLSLALEVIEQSARALAAAEACGVVHRDIKPSNIMLESDPSGAPIVKVIDYGVAKVLAPEAERGAEQTQTGFIGTPAFASPEQFAQSGETRLDTRSDIYSLGVTFWYLLSGRVPFVGRTLEEIRERQAESLPVDQLKGLDVPARIFALLKSMLAPDPKDRPQSARQLLSAVYGCYAKYSAEARARRRRSTLAAVGATLLIPAIALGAWLFQRSKSSALMDRSIAVLPFENLSDDKENAYLAEGIQDEILTRLSKIGDLRAISRTSTQHYKNKPENLREIAKQLGVAHVLEGSVQKSAGTVRVNVHLIKAVNNSPVWADTIDRPLTDILSLESEVAVTVADQLRAKLTGEEAQSIAAKPTDDPQAYDAYLRGLAYTLKSGGFEPANVIPAQQYLKEAVRLDPKFALAWSLLSSVDSAGYITATLPRTTALRDEAGNAAETAFRLQPNLGEAVSAKAFYHYVFLKDYDTALRYFEQAARLLPSDSRIPEALAFVERRRGRWEQSEAYFNRAERLDPRNVRTIGQHAVLYKMLRRFPDAVRKYEDVLNITPDDPQPVARQAAIFQAMGDLPRASALLTPLYSRADDDGTMSTQVYQAILERRTAPIIPRLKEMLSKPDSAPGDSESNLRFWLGWAQDVAGDHGGARESWTQAKNELESQLKEQPESYPLIGELALTEMKLGENASAMALADRGLSVNPIEKDAGAGPWSLEVFARVTAATGDHDRSIAALEKLLSIPYEGPLPSHTPLTPALLKLDPMFDPLRNDPRFKALTESSAAPVSL
jgi:serine/threonine protein kinase/Flp pilus assembly protein TadD